MGCVGRGKRAYPKHCNILRVQGPPALYEVTKPLTGLQVLCEVKFGGHTPVVL